MKEISLKPYLRAGRLEAGCDEAGRGPLAGPVYAAAVILPEDFHHPLLNDSKQMTEAARDTLRPIIEKEAIAWAVESVSPEEIDKLNILWASVTGMQRAVLRLDPPPEFLLIDGNKFRPFGRFGFKDYTTVVHGDDPEYGWERNMGYPTKDHIDAIRRHGLTPWHRKSFHVKQLEPTLF